MQIPFLLVSSRYAYCHVFSWFQLYDDEGYVMMSVRNLLRGDRLYDDIPILFGPALYFYNWIVHGVLRVPLTHDMVHFQTVALWLATVLALGLLAVLLTRSVAIALAAITTLAYLPRRASFALVLILKAAFAIFVLWPRIPLRPLPILDFATPWVWLALVPVGDEGPVDFPRTLVVTTTLLITLWLYPVVGTQLYLATALLVVPAAICAADAVAGIRSVASPSLDGAALRAAALVVVLAVFGTHAVRLMRFASAAYDAGTRVDLPGATRLRLDRSLANTAEKRIGPFVVMKRADERGTPP